MLTDTHCHLSSAQYPDAASISEIIKRAREAGVTRMITIGTDLTDSLKNNVIAEQHDGVFSTVGIHPTSTPEITDENWLEKIRDWATHPKAVAIGEIGLDYFHPAPPTHTEKSYRAVQREFFEQQLQLACELNHRVVIHQRDKGDESWRDLLEIMAPFHGKLRSVFHCFLRSSHDARMLLDHGHIVSFTGIATYSNAKNVLETAVALPAGSFMVETDAPYLAPVPHRGKRCEPAFVRDTAKFIAEARQESLEELAAHTETCADRFFRFSR